MAEATFLEQKRVRPGAALTVILMHGAALTALLLAKTEIVDLERFSPLKVIRIAPPPPPPPPPIEPTPTVPREQLHVVDATVPPIPTTRGITTSENPPPDQPALGSRPGGETVATGAPPEREDILPPRTPVRVAAQMIAGNLQPPYPASEQRMEREGRVVIQVTIGPDGRVIETRRVSATSNAFWQATERHARERWRFRPETVDGQPVQSTRILTVHFELTG